MRLGRNADIPALLALQAEVVPSLEHRVPRADLQIAVRCSTVIVAEHDGAVVGWGAATPVGRDWRILGIVVHHEQRRQGVGTGILEALAALASPTTRSIAAHAPSPEATRMLAKAGFFCLEGRFYREPERRRA
jgi:N-acetylglutamate synthase-like GNAT family acetyltransferase